MPDAILIHPSYDAIWSWTANHLARLWPAAIGAVQVQRLQPGDTRTAGELASPDCVRLVCLGVPLTRACLDLLPHLRAVHGAPEELRAELTARGIAWIAPASEGFWGQSVAECALALTLCGLRRIPQAHAAITRDHAEWDYHPPGGIGRPGLRCQQFSDDVRFAHGTVAGKRVRVVGLGNIGARYAQWCAMMGAEVMAYDPHANEAVFHRCGVRRETRLERLVADAEILAPMMPLRPATAGMLTAELMNVVPRGALVVLITRAGIVDMPTLRRRVLADELSLAADVFDVEPLPLDDPLLGRHNVVHTPHLAGRTRDANHALAESLLAAFLA